MTIVGVGGICGLIRRRWVWVESIGVVVRRYNYRFPHITINYYLSLLLLYLLFLAASPYFLFTL